MMVRRLSLIVPVLSAIAAVSTASAQPRPEVGPWGTMERLGETLQDRQERRDEAADRVEERYPEFFARRAELDRPILLTPIRLGGWPDALPVVEAWSVQPVAPPRPTPPPPAAPPRPISNAVVVPYEPLVLGGLFGFANPTTPIPAGPAEVIPAEVVPAVAAVVTLATPALPAPPPPPAPAPEPISPPPPPPPAEPAPPRSADAFLNFTDGPFPADSLAVGSPDAWHKSPAVSDLLGRSPNDAEQEDFKAEVLSKVERNFKRSGLDVDLTADPGPAAHTLSVVSGALARDNPEAIGIADIGGDGFTFLDNFVSPAIETIEDLETAVAHNISHELMHAFGVDYHDETGEVIDSGVIPWNLLTDDDLSFSAEAVDRLSSVEFQARWDDGLFLASNQVAEHGHGCSCHPSGPLATPEPATLAMWGLTLVGAAWSGRRWTSARA